MTAFWIELASCFSKAIGREYSWLSVKRKIMGPASQRPRHAKPSPRVEQVGEKIMSPSAGLTDVATNPLPDRTIKDESLNSEKQHQTPSTSRHSDGPDYTNPEELSPAFGGRVRRVLFSEAPKSTCNTDKTSNSQCAHQTHPQMRLRDPELPPENLQTSDTAKTQTSHATRRLSTQSNPDSHSGSSPGPTVPLSYSRGPQGSSSRKQVSRKRKIPAVGCESRKKIPTETMEVQRQRDAESPESIDGQSYPSDPDDLPLAPVRISRPSHVKRKRR